MTSTLFRLSINGQERRRRVVSHRWWRSAYVTAIVAAITTGALLLGHHAVARAQGTYCPTDGGFAMGYEGEVYAGSAGLVNGSASEGGTYSFIAGNISGTVLITGEFTITAEDCALGAAAYLRHRIIGSHFVPRHYSLARLPSFG